METKIQEESKYGDVKVGDVFMMDSGSVTWISKVISVGTNQFSLRSLTALNDSMDSSYWKFDGHRMSKFGSDWIERPATEEDVKDFHRRLPESVPTNT
jgi:hypothetical protein